MGREAKSRRLLLQACVLQGECDQCWRNLSEPCFCGSEVLGLESQPSLTAVGFKALVASAAWGSWAVSSQSGTFGDPQRATVTLSDRQPLLVREKQEDKPSLSGPGVP